MSIDLPSEFAAFAQSAVQTGGFQSETDVVVAGLRLLQERQDEFHQESKRKTQSGIDQLDRGEGRPADEVFERLERRAASIAA